MDEKAAKSVLALGFVTILKSEELGLSGGYLLLNPAGRPLEFHCTAPIRASRAQQILYGATLEPFLYGEQIAATLVAKAGIRPALVCTDQPPVLAAGQHIDLPVLLLPPERETTRTGVDAQWEGHDLLEIRLDGGDPRLTALCRTQDDRLAIIRALEQVGSRFDLCEPMERIREAIREAHRAPRRAA